MNDMNFNNVFSFICLYIRRMLFDMGIERSTKNLYEKICLNEPVAVYTFLSYRITFDLQVSSYNRNKFYINLNFAFLQDLMVYF